MKFTESQYKTISFVQAAGIVSVIIGHLNNQPFDVLHPYVFHMPLFFLLGGMLLSIDNGLFFRIKNTVTKHGLYLIKSYIITGVLSLLLVYYFNVEERKPFADGVFNTIIYTIKSNFGNNGLFVVGWFLLAYILANIACSVIAAITSKINNKKVVYLVVCFVSFYLGIIYFPSLHVDRSHYIANLSSQVFTATSFMLLGYTFKEYIFKLLRLDVALVLFFIMIIIKNSGLQKGVNMAWSVYPSGLTLSIFTSLSGIYILFCACHAFSTLTGASQLISYISRNTKSIMTYHIFSFFLVDLFFSFAGIYDSEKIATYAHYKNIDAWPLYVIAGVVIPLLMCFASTLSKKFVIYIVTSIQQHGKTPA